MISTSEIRQRFDLSQKQLRRARRLYIFFCRKAILQCGSNQKLWDVAITNPPFNIALEVIQKCLKEVRNGGLVIMLLRLNFFGSQERSEWFKKNMPFMCYVHSKRMKFTNTKGTDSIEYCHMVWVKGENPRFTKLRIL